jgi:hypothetical protein
LFCTESIARSADAERHFRELRQATTNGQTAAKPPCPAVTIPIHRERGRPESGSRISTLPATKGPTIDAGTNPTCVGWILLSSLLAVQLFATVTCMNDYEIAL